MTHSEIEVLIRKYNIAAMPDGTMKVQYAKKPSPQEYDALRAAKPEIIAHIQAKEAARNAALDARQARIRQNVPGLDELREAIENNRRQRDAFNRAMERGDGILPATSKIDLDAVKAAFPRAAAYIKADAASMASWDVKASAGRRAMERLIAGEDHDQVLADMDAEVTAGIDWNN